MGLFTVIEHEEEWQVDDPSPIGLWIGAEFLSAQEAQASSLIPPERCGHSLKLRQRVEREFILVEK
jgi:hypothetical protein